MSLTLTHLVALALSLPLWAQASVMPVVDRVQYVGAVAGHEHAYGYTTLDGRILLAPQCRVTIEREQQCLAHEAEHVRGHGECWAYATQLKIAHEQSAEALAWARELYWRYGEPACAANDVEGYDKY